MFRKLNNFCYQHRTLLLFRAFGRDQYSKKLGITIDLLSTSVIKLLVKFNYLLFLSWDIKKKKQEIMMLTIWYEPIEGVREEIGFIEKGYAMLLTNACSERAFL